MTAWGVAPARGRFRYCGLCGARLAFVELGRAGTSEEAQARLMAAVDGHLKSSDGCPKAHTFSGEVISACRCERPISIARDDGLRCARCEGLLAPEVAAPPPPSKPPSDPSGAAP